MVGLSYSTCQFAVMGTGMFDIFAIAQGNWSSSGVDLADIPVCYCVITSKSETQLTETRVKLVINIVRVNNKHR